MAGKARYKSFHDLWVGRQAHEELLRKVFNGAGILPARVHRLKTCATEFEFLFFWQRLYLYSADIINKQVQFDKFGCGLLAAMCHQYLSSLTDQPQGHE